MSDGKYYFENEGDDIVVKWQPPAVELHRMGNSIDDLKEASQLVRDYESGRKKHDWSDA